MTSSTPSKEWRPPPPAAAASTGTTRLSFWTIVVIAANTMNGPGLTTLPSVSHAAGQVTLVGLICASTILTSHVVQRLCLLVWNKHFHNHNSHSTMDDSTRHVHYPILEESDMVALAQDAFVATKQPQSSTHNHNNNKTLTSNHKNTTSSISMLRIRRGTALAMMGCALALALAQMMLCAKIADATMVASLGSACGWGVTMMDGGAASSLHCTSQLSLQPFSSVGSVVPATVDSGIVVRSGGVDSRNLQEEEENDDYMVSAPKKTKRAQQHYTQRPPPPVCLVTGGLVVASAITISLASVDLDSMVNAQFALFGCLLLACLRFCFVLRGSAAHPGATIINANEDSFLWLGDRPLDAVGPVLFNFAFVVTAPPLACGAQGGSQGAIRALTTACIIMGSLYAILGWLGAPAAAVAKGAGDDTNLLSLILQSAEGNSSWLDNLSVIVFGISQLAAIPVYCELAKETLEAHVATVPPPTTTTTVMDHSQRIPPKYHATSWLHDYSFYLCHVAPWLICAVTYNSTLFEAFVEWSSLLLLGFCNFSLPLLLEICTKEKQQQLKEHDGGSFRERKEHNKGSLGPVLWIFSITTATITAVIVQRLTESLLLAEGAFMMTVLGVINHF